MPGWVTTDGAKLGAMTYEDYGGGKTTNSFYLATCHPPTQLPWAYDPRTGTCKSVPEGSPNSFATQQDCMEDSPAARHRPGTPGSTEKRSPCDGGCIFLILFFGGAFTYFAAGFAYNRARHG